MPYVINQFACSADKYFDYGITSCVQCGTGKESKQGSVSASACQPKVDVPLVAGVVSACVIVLVAAGLYKYYLVWVQRHRIFQLLDFTNGPPPEGCTKLGMLSESSQFKRSVNQKEAAANALFYDLDRDRHPNLWKFVTSKLRSPALIDANQHISRIELVRVYQEIDFSHKLFEASRAVKLLDPTLKFETVHENIVKQPLFKQGQSAYDQMCSDLVPGLDGIKMMFAWHGCNSKRIGTICNTGLKKVAVATDPGFFGEGCYLSPECEYALRYARMSKQTNDRGEIGVVLFACECPLVPYVVTSADYPIAEPPLRDPGIPYGFSKFFGRQMQLACSAHWISVKQFTEWENPLFEYFKNNSEWDYNQPPVWHHHPSGKKVHGNSKPPIPATLKDLQEQKYIPIHDGSGPSGLTFQYQPDALPPSHVAREYLKNPDKEVISWFDVPNVLLPGALDHQYFPEDGCTGHELVLREGNMALPIAVVWFKKDVIEDAIKAADAAKAAAAAAWLSYAAVPSSVVQGQVYPAMFPHAPPQIAIAIAAHTAPARPSRSFSAPPPALSLPCIPSSHMTQASSRCVNCEGLQQQCASCSARPASVAPFLIRGGEGGG